jgi:hypothetical protein
VHRIIDRAAGYVPSPEDLQADEPDGRHVETPASTVVAEDADDPDRSRTPTG